MDKEKRYVGAGWWCWDKRRGNSLVLDRLRLAVSPTKRKIARERDDALHVRLLVDLGEIELPT